MSETCFGTLTMMNLFYNWLVVLGSPIFFTSLNNSRRRFFSFSFKELDQKGIKEQDTIDLNKKKNERKAIRVKLHCSTRLKTN